MKPANLISPGWNFPGGVEFEQGDIRALACELFAPQDRIRRISIPIARKIDVCKNLKTDNQVDPNPQHPLEPSLPAHRISLN